MERLLNYSSKVICSIDPWILERIAIILGFLFYLLSKNKRKIVYDNILTVTGVKNHQTAIRTFINIVMNFIEFLRVWRYGIEDTVKRTTFSGKEFLKLSGSHNGLILVTAHIGLWDIAARFVAYLNYKIGAVAEFKSVSKKHYDFMLMIRGYPEVKIFPLESDTTSRNIVKFLKRDKGILALLGDRDITGTGEKIKFFNRISSLPIGPAFLSTRLDVPVVISYLIRLKSWYYLLYISEPVTIEKTGDRKKDVEILQRKILLKLEDLIRTYLDQWLIFYPPWSICEKET